ncbi:MAG TPA: hypothetical protein DCF81_14155 [Erythrobacter sp.]|nr:hypothetical protein [Erythrobacter sp.]
MKLTRTLAYLLAVSVMSIPIAAQAQFGGLGKRILGDKSGVSSADAEGFLNGAMLSTKNVMISSALLAQALDNRAALASRKQQIDAISNAQDFGELNMHKSTLQNDLTLISDREDLSGDLQAIYEGSNDEQKKIIAVAIANLALGIYRNVDLAQKAPEMVKGIGRNPQLLTRVGEFKTAASLLGMQGKGLGTIGSALPSIMTALKIEPLPQSETTVPLAIEL